MAHSFAPSEPSDGRADGASPLPAGVTSALRSWLDEQHRAQRSNDASVATVRADEGTRRAMRQLCAEARRHGVRVEQLIVLLKQLVATIHATVGAEERHAARELLDGIIWVCIEEFYAPARSTATDARGAGTAIAGAPARPGDDRSARGA